MNIKNARIRKGFSQAQLANALGVHQTAVSQWEKGLAWPSSKILPEMARILDCSIDNLFDEREFYKATGMFGRDHFTASIIVKDDQGNVPYVDPTNCNAYLYFDEIKANADNYEAVLNEPGANHLIITVYRDHWHIETVSGYTPERGIYSKIL